jgi:hypothetical protein
MRYRSGNIGRVAIRVRAIRAIGVEKRAIGKWAGPDRHHRVTEGFNRADHLSPKLV